jgi:hypothetical protein
MDANFLVIGLKLKWAEQLGIELNNASGELAESISSEEWSSPAS